MSMSQPVLFVIDDDAGIVRALRDDLGRRFGEDFRVIGETSAAAGLSTLRGLAELHEPVALLIVDHNMSEMPGVDFLARAHDMHPLAKRVLLVERDYSARSPVVQAMTLGQADYHITKPWMLEQDLYREVSGFLAEWAKDQRGRLRAVPGHRARQDRGTHELRELLTRFGVPFRFHRADSERGRQLLAEQGLDASRLPVHDPPRRLHDGRADARSGHRGDRREHRQRRRANATSSSSEPDRPASPPPSMPHPRAC